MLVKYLTWTGSVLFLIACEGEPAAIKTGGGDKNPEDTSDNTQIVDSDNCESILVATIRDFPATHPDFNHPGETQPTLNMVELHLGSDDKPIMKTPSDIFQHLDEWYNDVPGVNQSFKTEIPLTEMETGLWTFANSAFFPLGPDVGFGADIPGYAQNYLFTTEIELQFVYEPGQVFTFTGDDDMWVFINRTLAIDLGGIHIAREASVDIEQFSNQYGLGLAQGHKYPMHIFHAERHPEHSNFRIDTTISCFIPIVVK